MFAGREEDTEPKGIGPDMTIAVLSGSPPSREYKSYNVQSSLTWGNVDVDVVVFPVVAVCGQSSFGGNEDVNVEAIIDRVGKASCADECVIRAASHRLSSFIPSDAADMASGI